MKNVVLVVIAVLALGAAAYFTMNRSGGGTPANESLERTAYFTCRNGECKHEFTLTVGEVTQAGGHPACPECSKRTTARMAAQCPQCQRNMEFIGHAGMPDKCEHCGHVLDDRGLMTKEAEFHKAVSGEGG